MDNKEKLIAYSISWMICAFVEGGNCMKKMATIVLGLMLALTLVGCGNNAQSSDAHNAEYEEGYAAGYEV